MKRTVQTFNQNKGSEALAAFPFRLHVRTDLHLTRKVFHMLTGMAIAFSYLAGVPAPTLVIVLSSILGFVFMIETARLRIPAFNEKMIRFFSPIIRSHECEQPTAIPPYLLSAVIAVLVFPKPIAILSILFLACGDPLASVFGILYGKHSIRFANGKSLIGSLAGILTCAAITFMFLKMMSIPMPALLAVTMIGGLAGGTAEMAPVDVDDNFSIPVISGFVLWLAFIVFGV
ncbi:MAG TPA: hypothetical protein DCS07_02070 [Bdellovibrionales bacterium]|nr:MAG: hypothetical protein A2Z97_16235 [Bdellovibrionales bacterium GWB1_52_6]OFZ04540.1 MAG: hypothetical protein A2X97_13025 [Bdellovibrionales bacterium GWA1_52_35]OFZ44043.1 MAG: hypothetical protein A2070_03965 [Bdellovibrionales bacterium GWC1_52_8]HAR41411.1 hypothetical protein [Bdellovibrionales bacterium]HCM39948.1 hypothetical protein [Bdellovibrionales bacterium]